jgi:hypothetical protein
MAGGSAYKSPEKPTTTLPGKPQDAWNGPASEPPQVATKGSIAKRAGGRRNSIMDLLDQHGDQDKQLIDRAGFEALCDELGLRLNTIEKRRAFSSLDAMDGSKDGQLEYSYVRRRPALAPGVPSSRRCYHLTQARRCPGPRLGQGQAPIAVASRTPARPEAV